MAEGSKYLRWVGAVGAVAVLVTAGWLVVPRLMKKPNRKGPVDSAELSSSKEGGEREVPFKAVQPKKDPSLVLSVQQLLTIEPFFEADLRAQVPGVVNYVQKAIGDPVFKGE